MRLSDELKLLVSSRGKRTSMNRRRAELDDRVASVIRAASWPMHRETRDLAKQARSLGFEPLGDFHCRVVIHSNSEDTTDSEDASSRPGCRTTRLRADCTAVIICRVAVRSRSRRPPRSDVAGGRRPGDGNDQQWIGSGRETWDDPMRTTWR